MTHVTDCTFDIGNFALRGKRWDSGQGLPVLALHGWLDNCASFDFLAPHLDGLDLVCLDLAGHGHSDHRQHLGAYNIWQDVGELFAVADQLNWRRFGLIGHSRGAAIALLAAGAFPQRISHLALLEGACPQLDTPEQSPQRLAASIEAVAQHSRRARRYYSSFELAVKARETGLFALSHSDAQALARRGVMHTEQGFVWTHDAKLLADSEVRFSSEQVEAFYHRLNMPVLSVWGEQGILPQMPMLAGWLDQHPRLPRQYVGGHHHCHMSTNAEQVAQALDSLFVRRRIATRAHSEAGD